MGLTNKQIIELNELCNAAVEGTQTAEQRETLSQWLRSSAEAREFYVRAMGLSASLFSYAGEMQADAPGPVPARPAGAPLRLVRWLAPLAAIAAVLAVSVWVGHRTKPKTGTAKATTSDEFVAQLTGAKGCRWADAATPASGDHLHKKQRLNLAEGFAEITFDSGAQVILEGPARLDINSAWDATLYSGTLKATVPPEAVGFRVAGPAVEVVDLGTEFSMIADGGGTTDVLVLKGSVEAAPQNAADQQTVLLREKESCRFDESGTSAVSDSDEKFARFGQPEPLNRFAPPTRLVHWSFDETAGRTVKAVAFGARPGSYDARLESVSDDAAASQHPAGRRERALRFDGKLFAKAAFPGISDNSPRTIAFWVKVPKDAPLSNAYAMVAWRAQSTQVGPKSVHVGWNRNPLEGTVGVLRTDYGAGFALGATPLRDGRWHHVAIVYVPGPESGAPVQVKQYVDGRFEGEGKPSPPGRRSAPATTASEDGASAIDSIWLGCRLGISGPRKERFSGEMDELFIADRALGPREIVRIMRENQLSQGSLPDKSK